MSTFSPKKKTVSYIINPSNDQSSASHHSLGVNALQYDNSTDTLISGGRDGLLTLWAPTVENNPINPFDKDAEILSPTEIKDFISQNIENETGLSKLESSIRENGLSNLPILKANYKPSNSTQLHLDWINDLKLIPKNTFVASCSNDLSVKLYNYQENSISTLGWHNDYVKCLATHLHNPNELISGGLDKSINIWDINKQSKSSSYTFNQERGSIYSVATCDNLIVTGGPTQIVTLFDKRTMNKPIKSFVGHTENVRCLCLKPTSILSGSSDSTIKLWDLRTNRIMRNFDMHNSSIWSLYAPQDTDQFDVFYSGDKSGLLLKTDLKSSNLNMVGAGAASQSTSNNAGGTDYLNTKLNESLGICTIIADLNLSQYPSTLAASSSSSVEQSPLGSVHSLPSNVTAGVLSIVEGSNSLWASTSNTPTNQFITNWNIPVTDKLIMYQGIKLNRNLRMINKSGQQQHQQHESTPTNALGSQKNSIELKRGESELDIVSQFSNDDLDHLDQALTSQLALNVPTLEINSQLYIDANLDGDADGDSEVKFATYLLSLNGGPNSEFIINDDDEDDEERKHPQDGNCSSQKLHIVYEKLPESLVTLTPYNILPSEVILGSNGLIKSRLLNNRRHVATMDAHGCIYIIDIVNCSVIKTVETNAKQNNNSNGSNVDLHERFDELTEPFQTEETLPMWCNVQCKAGKLNITLQESNFLTCEVYSDELFANYPELQASSADQESEEALRFNLGKIVLKSLFKDFINYELDPSLFKERKLSTPLPALKKTNTTSSTLTATKTETNRSTGDLEKPKRKLFGRSRLASSSSTGSTNDQATPSSPPPTPLTTEEQADQCTTTNELIDFIHRNMQNLINRSTDLLTPPPAQPITATTTSTSSSSTRKDSTTTPVSPLTPTVQIHQDVTLVISENLKQYGSEAKPLYHLPLSTINSHANIKRLEQLLPTWVSKGVLLDKYVVKDAVKLGFILLPYKYTDSEKEEQEQKALQPLETSKLNANSLLRVSKISEFIFERLPQLDKELVGDKKNLVIICKGEQLDEKMTMITVKTRLWKSSGDVELLYKLK